MPLYKVWDVLRKRRKMVFCGTPVTVPILLQKGSEKLGSICTKIILEQDGTEIDDDDVLAQCDKEILILTADGEEWKSSVEHAAVVCNDIESNSNQDDVPSTDDVPVPSTSARKAINPNSVGENSSLPRFSEYVLQNLKEGNALLIWRKLIEESACYYMSNYNLCDSGEYKIIGRKMYGMYPCIAHTGEHPWSLFTKNLSQRVRHMRWDRKRKSTPEEHSSKGKEGAVTFTPNLALEAGDGLSEEDYNCHVTEIKKEWTKSKPNHGHIKILLKESYSRRRTWISSLPHGSAAPILESFPCFEDGNFVLFELTLIMSTDRLKHIKDGVEPFMKEVERMMKQDIVTEGPLRMISIIEFIEISTRYDRGRGKKSTSIMTVLEDIPDGEIAQHLTSDPLESPNLMIFVEAGHLKGAYIKADTKTIECKTINIEHSILVYIAAYYILNLNYPRIYSQCMGFLQCTLFGEVYSLDKSQKYRVFYKKFMEKN